MGPFLPSSTKDRACYKLELRKHVEQRCLQDRRERPGDVRSSEDLSANAEAYTGFLWNSTKML